jgi:hypothetical protein
LSAVSSVSIDRSPQDVYDFASKPENLPKWATGLGESIKIVDGELFADGPMGRIRIRMAKKNDLGILDHDATFESGVMIHNPMRVVPKGAGSEDVFTFFRQPDMTDEQLSRDAQWAERDLRILKGLLEQ